MLRPPDVGVRALDAERVGGPPLGSMEKLLYGPACTKAADSEQKASKKYAAAKKKVKSAKTAAGKKKAQARAKKLRSAYLKAKKSRKTSCAKAGEA